MAPISPGKASGPPRRPHKPTETTKAHRYEPFTKRLAKLKIDPVHKVQKSRLREESDDISQSYFRSALEEWSELNLTTTFTSFLNRVLPLSESLPQLLHHADEVASALLEHIEKQDSLALEPLLSLVAHLAHDLGQETEKYFAQIVSLVAKVSTTQDDPAIVEACFTCLAWMYKYLSRLLVHDLRPLLDVVFPYFMARKEHVRRFTAEALAFLLRKAAVLYPKNSKPLTLALTHILNYAAQLSRRGEQELFAETVMNLLSETALGVDAALHSSAADLFQCFLELTTLLKTSFDTAHNILQGTTINLVHKTDAAGFKPIADLVLQFASITAEDDSQTLLSSRLMLIVAATRGGSRISQWSILVKLLAEKLPLHSVESTNVPSFVPVLTSTAAAALCYAPLDQMLPLIPTLVNSITSGPHPAQFFAFCETVARLSKARFQDLLLSYLQQYIVSHWSTDEPGLVLLLNDLHQLGCVHSNSGKPGYLAIAREWEACIRREWQETTQVVDHQPQRDLLDLLLAQSIHFPMSREVEFELENHLQHKISLALSDADNSSDLQRQVVLGWGLQTLVALKKGRRYFDEALFKDALNVSKDTFRLLPFVEAMAEIAPGFSDTGVLSTLPDVALLSLQENLLSTSIPLRKASIRLLSSLQLTGSSEWLVPACRLFLEILNTEYTISNARTLSMLVRKLPQTHARASQNSKTTMIVPHFALGLLSNFHDRLRKDVALAIGQMMTEPALEEAIVDILRRWLQQPASGGASAASTTGSKDNLPSRVSPYSCTRLEAVQDTFEEARKPFCDAMQEVISRVRSAHAPQLTGSLYESRQIALQVLIEMPLIAEKKSKLLVPAFLAAQRGRSGSRFLFVDDANSVNTVTPDIEEQTWSLKERELFLELLRQFNNPRVLYRADDVYRCLLDLLANGDPETRKLSLQAVFGWKSKVLVIHQDNLLKIAEDKQTTSELALMLDANDESSMMKDEDRAEVLPVLLRLVFGQLIGRVGVHGSQEAKRKALLRLVFRMHDEEVLTFLDIVLGRLHDISASSSQEDSGHILDQDFLPLDQQYGFLRMVLSMVEILQTRFSPFVLKVFGPVAYCTLRASNQINLLEDTETAPTLLRNIRRTGIQCLNSLFETAKNLDFSPFMESIYGSLISPRISRFVSENTEGISGLLKMFAIWARSIQTLDYLRLHDDQILRACWGLLASENAKAVVKIFVFEEIILPAVDLASQDVENHETAEDMLVAQAPSMLASISTLLQQSPSKELLLTTAKATQRLVFYVTEDAAKVRTIDLLVEILGEPKQRLPPLIKGQILRAVKEASERLEIGKYYKGKFFELLSGFLDFFRDKPNREICVQILQHIAHEETILAAPTAVCQQLGTSSSTQLGEKDYEQQGEAFAKIHDLLQHPEPRSLLPVLHNLIFLLRTSEETATRGNALSCLKHSVTAMAEVAVDVDVIILRRIVLDAIRKHIKDDSELVRADFVELLGTVVGKWSNEESLQDMRILLVGNDEEASFFTNILHIQQHRRLRAMHRLITAAQTGAITAPNIAGYFLPLLQKFADDEATNETAQATKGQSIASMTTLLQWLDWKTFRSVFRHYRQSLQHKTDDAKIDVRLLSHAADALTIAIERRSQDKQNDTPFPHLAKTLPTEDTIAQELKTHFIPQLAELSHYKDEGELSQRLPAAVVAIKLIKLLPASEVSLLASPVILDIAQVLRSRTQETRDMARNKLAEAVNILGISSLQFVLKELRTALTQGYQLHVLSYTMHTMLLATKEERQIGDLDYCLDDIMKIILDDVFGIVGQQKENQDYISSMKEVKANRSFDAIEIVASGTTVQHLSKLVLPFEPLLTGFLTSKQVRHVDELLRRIGVGISHSPAASSQDLLVFAYELIQSFYKARPAAPARVLTNDEKNRDRYIVQKDNVRKVGTVSTASLLFKIAKFAIDIARSTFARHQELMTSENVHGFIPVIGDALVEGQEDVKISAMRLLSTVVKLKLSELDINAKLYVIEAVKLVKGATSTNEEAAQAALKVVAAIIREKRDVEVRDSDIAYLLKRTMPDLEEPDRQGVTFNFIKAVMTRQMQMLEVYELVDKLGLMMVTSQSRNSREAARGVYVHFILDYPQGKARWSKQVKFLVKNLEYQYPEGRQSVMEAISILLSKIDRGAAKELASVVFVPTVLRMANDENERCREMAAALLALSFRTTPKDSLSTMLEPLRAWLEQEDNLLLRKISLQTWSIYLESVSNQSHSEITSIKEQCLSILRNPYDNDVAWEVKYHTLELLRLMVKQSPQNMLTKQEDLLWDHIVSSLHEPHTWLQYSASSLIALFFRECIEASSTSVPLLCSWGLSMNETRIVEILRFSLKILKHHSTGVDLAEIVMQNLLFLGRVVDRSNTQIALKSLPDRDEDADEDVVDGVSDEDIVAELELHGHQPVDDNKQSHIAATKYILDQSARTLRREPAKQTTAVLQPKLSFTSLLTHMVPLLSETTLLNNSTAITQVIIPLLHLTSPSTPTPRSSDPLFATSYTTFVERATITLETIQSVLGDQAYMKCVMAATKMAREKRQERRQKRAIEVVAEPERAAQEKKRRHEKEKRRKKEVKGVYRSNRRRDLGF